MGEVHEVIYLTNINAMEEDCDITDVRWDHSRCNATDIKYIRSDIVERLIKEAQND